LAYKYVVDKYLVISFFKRPPLLDQAAFSSLHMLIFLSVILANTFGIYLLAVAGGTEALVRCLLLWFPAERNDFCVQVTTYIIYLQVPITEIRSKAAEDTWRNDWFGRILHLPHVYPMLAALAVAVALTGWHVYVRWYRAPREEAKRRSIRATVRALPGRLSALSVPQRFPM
jgi:hypothetical protein